MASLLEQLRSKPRPVRLGISVGMAAVLTILIGLAWGIGLPSGDKNVKRTTAKAPTPLNALVGSVKGTFQQEVDPSQSTEIIDAGAPTPLAEQPDDSGASTQLETETSASGQPPEPLQ